MTDNPDTKEQILAEARETNRLLRAILDELKNKPNYPRQHLT